LINILVRLEKESFSKKKTSLKITNNKTHIAPSNPYHDAFLNSN
jgi:hypothetical protein